MSVFRFVTSGVNWSALEPVLRSLRRGLSRTKFVRDAVHALVRLIQTQFRSSLIGSRGLSVSERRTVRLRELWLRAEAEEAKNKSVEEHLAFKREEGALIKRIDGARTTGVKLQGRMDEYKTPISIPWRWLVLIAMGVSLFLIFSKGC